MACAGRVADAGPGALYRARSARWGHITAGITGAALADALLRSIASRGIAITAHLTGLNTERVAVDRLADSEDELDEGAGGATLGWRPRRTLMIDAALLPIADLAIIAFMIALTRPDTINAGGVLLIAALAARRIDDPISADALGALLIPADQSVAAALSHVLNGAAEIADEA